MTIGEMWHYMVFQTKGYRRLQAAIVLGALTAAAVPYLNSVFYARILDFLLLSRYDAAVHAVIWMTISLLVLNLAAKGCERMVYHYCEPCEYEVKKRTAKKAFSMEYECVDRMETLTAFRRVRAGEQGMGGVQRQMSDGAGICHTDAGGVYLYLYCSKGAFRKHYHWGSDDVRGCSDYNDCGSQRTSEPLPVH